MPKSVVSVIQEGGMTEIQWGNEEPVNGRIHGYVLIDENGILSVPFRNDEDEPFVFVLDENHGRVVLSEDQPPSDQDTIVWSS